MVLILVVVLLAMVYFRGQASATTNAQVQKVVEPTASPASGQQGVTGNGDFQSLLNAINQGLSTVDHIIQTTTQKN